jgi:hypothetical protein
MPRNLLILLASTLSVVTPAWATATASAAPALHGFSVAAAARELLLEKQFDTELDPAQRRTA